MAAATSGSKVVGALAEWRISLRKVRRMKPYVLSEKEERLLALGYDRGAKTIFIWEGVTYYLTEAAVRDTLERVRTLAAPGSTIVFDAWARPKGALGALASISRAASNQLVRALDEPFLFAFPTAEAAGSLLRDTGFEPIFVHGPAYLRETLRACGRPLLYTPSYLVVAAGRIPERT